jgi:hypothetical protein
MSHLERLLHLYRLTCGALQPFERQMLVAIALFALLAPLAFWEFDAIRAAPLEPLGAFALGVILGVMTGVGFVVRQR